MLRFISISLKPTVLFFFRRRTFFREERPDFSSAPCAAANRTDAVQYHCDYCQKDISNCLRISCAVCPEFDLCVECFSVGVELKGHKNDHDFRIIDNMHFPFLSDDWGADEELLLLEGLEINGYGNWEDVAEHITTKTKREVEEHYMKYYRTTPAWPLLDLTKVLSSRADVMRLNGLPYRADAPRADSSSSTSKKSNPKFQPSHPVRPDLSNLMPFRGEFEIEWDNDAEMPIKDLEVDSRDTQDEKDIKVKLFQLYNLRVEEREEKRRFVLERGLHDVKRISAQDKKRQKEEKDLYAKTRKFATLLTQAEWDDYVKNILAEKLLRAKISELQNLRTNGVRTLADADIYRKEQKKREADKNKWRSSTRSRGWEAPPAPMDKKAQKALNQSLGAGLGGGGAAISTWSPALKPGYELLGDSEKALCEIAKITPLSYLSTKETLIREALAAGGALSLDQARAAVPKIEPQKVQKVFDYLVECSWITKSAVTAASGAGHLGLGSTTAGGMGGGSLLASQKPHFIAHAGHHHPHSVHPGLNNPNLAQTRIALNRGPAITPIPGVGRPGM